MRLKIGGYEIFIVEDETILPNESRIGEYSPFEQKMNVHTSVISELKLGRIKKPSFNLVCKIADALGIKVDELRNSTETILKEVKRS
ncbi:helix-turn-helix domain-containing protein [Enterococcus avium]|uniref:helix-turn-helix domain-containing protein n=1 Tax=Enterococcus avium TaxID=33945 RepID=UPI00288F46CB|nr:helix-turn-helix domain-containing protein [Enterococcus avium]MDT2390997.1 XRE family transcriptional regulator [Enterococcus avium]